MESLKILLAVVFSLGTASAATVSPLGHTRLLIKVLQRWELQLT